MSPATGFSKSRRRGRRLRAQSGRRSGEGLDIHDRRSTDAAVYLCVRALRAKEHPLAPPTGFPAVFRVVPEERRARDGRPIHSKCGQVPSEGKGRGMSIGSMFESEVFVCVWVIRSVRYRGQTCSRDFKDLSTPARKQFQWQIKQLHVPPLAAADCTHRWNFFEPASRTSIRSDRD